MAGRSANSLKLYCDWKCDNHKAAPLFSPAIFNFQSPLYIPFPKVGRRSDPLEDFWVLYLPQLGMTLKWHESEHKANLDHSGYSEVHDKADLLISSETMQKAVWMPPYYPDNMLKNSQDFVTSKCFRERKMKLLLKGKLSLKHWNRGVWQLWQRHGDVYKYDGASPPSNRDREQYALKKRLGTDEILPVVAWCSTLPGTRMSRKARTAKARWSISAL